MAKEKLYPKSTKEGLEIRVWDTYSNAGKALAVAMMYCGLDGFVQACTGNHIHELLGLNVPDPIQMITDTLRTMTLITGIGHGLYKLTEDFFIGKDKYLEKYRNKAKYFIESE